MIVLRVRTVWLEGLTDRTRRPFRYANQLPEPVEAVVATNCEKPHCQIVGSLACVMDFSRMGRPG